MKAVVETPVTVKCRIGVDDQEPREALFAMTEALVAAGVDGLAVHARKAWPKGLSPKETPHSPARLSAGSDQLKRAFPDLPMAINGGVATLEDAAAQLEIMDGVMVGLGLPTTTRSCCWASILWSRARQRPWRTASKLWKPSCPMRRRGSPKACVWRT